MSMAHLYNCKIPYIFTTILGARQEAEESETISGPQIPPTYGCKNPIYFYHMGGGGRGKSNFRPANPADMVNMGGQGTQT